MSRWDNASINHLGTTVTLPSVALVTLSSMASLIWLMFSTLQEVVESWPFSQSLYFSRMGFCCSVDRLTHQPQQKKAAMLVPWARVASGLLMVRGLLASSPQMRTVDPGPRCLMSSSVTSPPPRQSKRTLKPWSLIAFWQSSSQLPWVMITCLAPSFFSRAACSSLRTMLRRGMPRSMQRLFSILPTAEAAAVWMSPLWPAKASQVSVKPMTVMGLMAPEAALGSGTSAPISKQQTGSGVAYSAHDPMSSPVKATLLPTQCWRSAPLAATTLPTPSEPVRVGRGGTPNSPSILRRSTGLTAAPSTQTRSRPAAGSGLGASSKMGASLIL